MNTREKINMTHDDFHNLWNGIYHKGNPYEMRGEIYRQVQKINTSQFSDGPSWDYIIQRESDGKFFKFNVWDAGEHNGYLFEDDLEEVFETMETKPKYE